MNDIGRKLLFVVNHAGFFLSHRLPLALAARDRGWDVHVSTPHSKHVPLIREADLSWREIRLTRSGTSLLGEVRTLRDLRHAYRELRPTLVHHVTTKPVLWGTIASRLEGVPAVVNALAGLGHLSLADDAFHRILGRIVRVGFRLSLRHPRMKVIFQNNEDRELFTRAGILSEEQAVLIPGSGVDPDVFRPSRRVGGNIIPTVMLPSRMLYSKGVAEFVSAARLLRGEGVKARFVLVGEPDPDNPASVEVNTLNAWEKDGSVEIWGRRDDMPAVYSSADIVCLPSYREGMPKVLIEAAACGLPTVSTDVPGCRDVVIPGETGLLVRPRDEGRELAEAIKLLLENPLLRKRMGDSGRKRVIERFSLSRIIDLTLSLYESVAG